MTPLLFSCWIFLQLSTLLTTKFPSPAWTLFLAFSLLHSNGFSHISQTDISPLQSSSSPSQLMYCVTNGSVVGPILFVRYTTPLSDIITNHSVNHQLFADDTQLQKSAPLSEVTKPHQRTQCIHRRHKNMDDWKSAQIERRQNRSSILCFPFHFHWNLLPFPSLNKHLLLWFCREPWIHSRLKPVHEEARHKNLSN